MGIMDLLGPYREPNRNHPHVFEDFDQVANEAEPDEIREGLVEAFNSDDTPPFEEMVSQLYERSDPQQRAGLLEQILGSLGGGAAGGAAGGILGDLLRNATRGGRISPEQAQRIPKGEIEVATREAAKRNPNIIEQVGDFYSRQPQIVKTLGQAALAIALARMARRRRV